MPIFCSVRDLTGRFRITAQTLRNWERAGKIPPAGRTAGGHRRYTEAHIAAIHGMLSSAANPGAANQERS